MVKTIEDLTSLSGCQPLAVYFGTFNPVHYGHLQIAQAVLNEGFASQVAFIPTGNPPNRTEDKSLVAGHHRLEMLKRATSKHPHLSVWPDEVAFQNPERIVSLKQNVNYTVDTLESRFQLTKQTQPLNLPFILGEDSFNSLESWKNIDLLLLHCHFLLVRRHPQGVISPLPRCSYSVLNLPLLPVSATQIRQQFSTSKVPHFLTPESVIQYCQWNQLY